MVDSGSCLIKKSVLSMVTTHKSCITGVPCTLCRKLPIKALSVPQLFTAWRGVLVKPVSLWRFHVLEILWGLFFSPFHPRENCYTTLSFKGSSSLKSLEGRASRSHESSHSLVPTCFSRLVLISKCWQVLTYIVEFLPLSHFVHTVYKLLENTQISEPPLSQSSCPVACFLCGHG